MITVYMVGGLFWLTISVIAWASAREACPHSQDVRRLALAVFATPVWPLGVLYGIGWGTQVVFRDAFGDVIGKEES